MMSKNYKFPFCAIVLCVECVAIAAPHGGVFRGRDQTIIAREVFATDGVVQGDESVYIEAGELKGSGIIRSPNITIFAKKFSFTGAIDCAKVGVITTQKPVDPSKFKVAGAGKVSFKVDPKLELPSEKPINALPGWWKLAFEGFKQAVTPTSGICKVSVHVVANQVGKKTKAYIDFEKAVHDIEWFVTCEALLSQAPAVELVQRMQKLDWQAISTTKGVKCFVDCKDLNVSELSDAVDSKLAPAHISFAVFILYDTATGQFAEVCKKRSMSPDYAIHLFFDPAALGMHANVRQYRYLMQII